jgi:glycosyltransferase involved in cell wall biosynthesis
MPPLKKMNAVVYTYFQQKLFLEIPKELGFYLKIKLFLKSIIIKNLKKNTNFWIVQTNLIKTQLSKKFNIIENSILELPFYPSLKSISNTTIIKKENIFLYISNATSHKNHYRLIEAFENFYEKFQFGELYLTVYDNIELINLITKKNRSNIPIFNLNKIEGAELEYIYQKSKFVIFPSLSESFGLGLVEAIEFNCIIIGANLPYTFEVCTPSLSFNPYDIESIEECFHKAMNSDYNNTIPKVSNKIKDILKILNND